MSKVSFQNLCAVFMAIAFTSFVIGSPSEAQAQSQEKIEKANSISNWLIVGALVITAVAIIVTVSKGDKKDKEKEGEKNDAEAQELRRYSEAQVQLETSSSGREAFASSEYEAGEAIWKPNHGSVSPVQNAFLQDRGCLLFAHEMK